MSLGLRLSLGARQESAAGGGSSTPANALVTEDGTFLVTEDGTYLVWE